MAKTIVNHFEPVEVKEEHGKQRIRVALKVFERLAEPVEEERAVGQGSQGIVQSQMTQLFLEDFSQCDIRERTGHTGCFPVGASYNKAALPAAQFRTDDWPGITVNNK